MKLTQPELETICIAIMQIRNPEGKMSIKWSEVAMEIARQAIETKKVVIHLDGSK